MFLKGRMMKKLALATLVATLALTACQKTETPAPADTATASATSTAPTADTTPPASAVASATDNTHAHHSDEHANHDMHNHDNHAGDTYQCGDKTLQISVHEHEGESQAQITSDNITYDLESDVQTKGRFTSSDSITGDDKGMALMIEGNRATITTLDDKKIVECTKQ